MRNTVCPVGSLVDTQGGGRGERLGESAENRMKQNEQQFKTVQRNERQGRVQCIRAP